MFLTIIITTYNRRKLVQSAISSALFWANHRDDVEIVVVDDCSTDSTVSEIKKTYHTEISSGIMRIIRLEKNLGVTGAKNVGARIAHGDWITFLDSDDELRTAVYEEVLIEISKNNSSIIFFRALNVSQNQLIGEQSHAMVSVTLGSMLKNWPWGDCIPFIKRTNFLHSPYDQDLRGFEGIAYLRTLKRGGTIVIAPILVLCCTRDGHERLSTPLSLRKRACYLAKGHLRIAKEFSKELGIMGFVKQTIKGLYYALHCVKNNLLK